MKKHIFGIVLFNLIVISFGLAYAFLNVPAIPTLPKIEEVKSPVYQSSYRASCRKNMQTRAKLTAEVIGSYYYVSEDKIVTKIRVSLNDEAAMPDKLYVTVNYSQVTRDIDKTSFGDMQIIENPFNTSRVREFSIVSRISGESQIDIKDNIYTQISVSDSNGSLYGSVGDLSAAKPVMKIYADQR